MNEQAKNPRIIIDASYIRGMSGDGSPLRTMREQGGRIVLIDTLTYELFSSTDDSRKWSESTVKLAEHRDYIEVWKHVPEMWRFELTKKCPCGDPLDYKMTKRIKKMLANDPQWKPSDPKKIIDQAKRNREDNSIVEVFKAPTDIELFTEEEKKKIRRKQICDKEVVQLFYDFVNDPSRIRSRLEESLIKSFFHVLPCDVICYIYNNGFYYNNVKRSELGYDFHEFFRCRVHPQKEDHPYRAFSFRDE